MTSIAHDNTAPPPGAAILTPAEVAKLFRVDSKTPTRWANAGKLTAFRTPGGHRRFLADEVFGLIAATNRNGQPS